MVPIQKPSKRWYPYPRTISFFFLNRTSEYFRLKLWLNEMTWRSLSYITWNHTCLSKGKHLLENVIAEKLDQNLPSIGCERLNDFVLAEL